MKGLRFIVLALALVMPIITLVKGIQFQQDCSGYIKQAADANSVELAIERIDKAIAYVEANDLTEGYTSVLWKTEDDNIGFWYNNLKTCREELAQCIESSQFEKTNVLMKVRESLTDQGEDGTELTLPKGISRYPKNALFGILNWISCILLLLIFLDMSVFSYKTW